MNPIIRNILANQTSPYLRQHRDNPVNWQIFGEQAFIEAERRNCPVLLSIGYAACHWCHVMALESFTDPQIGLMINQHFIAIKVDREERPDVDNFYQAALAAQGIQGGWPLTMFLTPQRQPFWGGTYFPDQPRHGMPSLRQVLMAVHQLWVDQPEKIKVNVHSLHQALIPLAHKLTPDKTISDHNSKTWSLLPETVFNYLDRSRGGFSGAPKFPQVPFLDLLWCHYRASGKKNWYHQVITTLNHLCHGGIYDHIGGGWARYATDESWLIPHFEKMLYDNALIPMALTQAWQVQQNRLYEHHIEETFSWLQRDMQTSRGLWAASLDADSKPNTQEKAQEGAFYIWSWDELEKILSDWPDRHDFYTAYGISQAGDWKGVNILHTPIALDYKTQRTLAQGRALLLATREKRPKPGRDDKVLTDWNAMMVSAMARAGMVFNRPVWIQQASQVFDTLLGNMVVKNRLHHVLHGTTTHIAGFLDDYAWVIEAALTLYMVDFNRVYLDTAQLWAENCTAIFKAPNGGFYLSPNSDLPIRQIIGKDQATPAANGVLARVFIHLWHHTGKDSYRQSAQEIITAFSTLMQRDPIGYAGLGAADFFHQHPVSLTCSYQDQAIRQVAHHWANPGLIIMPARDVQPGAIICEGQTCQAPITDAQQLNDNLRAIFAPNHHML